MDTITQEIIDENKNIKLLIKIPVKGSSISITIYQLKMDKKNILSMLDIPHPTINGLVSNLSKHLTMFNLGEIKKIADEIWTFFNKREELMVEEEDKEEEKEGFTEKIIYEKATVNSNLGENGKSFPKEQEEVTFIPEIQSIDTVHGAIPTLKGVQEIIEQQLQSISSTVGDDEFEARVMAEITDHFTRNKKKIESVEKNIVEVEKKMEKLIEKITSTKNYVSELYRWLRELHKLQNDIIDRISKLEK
ncbi:MAG: hypothetical protein GF308_00185 [Candidatus Heimdallarchaeota archaeon]|nr:hypothetical protein [Candidatus Heimdallarchaeota archaeon]